MQNPATTARRERSLKPGERVTVFHWPSRRAGIDPVRGFGRVYRYENHLVIVDMIDGTNPGERFVMARGDIHTADRDDPVYGVLDYPLDLCAGGCGTIWPYGTADDPRTSARRMCDACRARIERDRRAEAAG